MGVGAGEEPRASDGLRRDRERVERELRLPRDALALIDETVERAREEFQDPGIDRQRVLVSRLGQTGPPQFGSSWSTRSGWKRQVARRSGRCGKTGPFALEKLGAQFGSSWSTWCETRATSSWAIGRKPVGVRGRRRGLSALPRLRAKPAKKTAARSAGHFPLPSRVARPLDGPLKLFTTK